MTIRIFFLAFKWISLLICIHYLRLIQVLSCYIQICYSYLFKDVYAKNWEIHIIQKKTTPKIFNFAYGWNVFYLVFTYLHAISTYINLYFAISWKWIFLPNCNFELVIKTCSARLYFQILQRNKSDSTTRLQLQFGRKIHFQLIAKYKFIYVEMAWR
jgi:hypothetical protein